MMLAKANSCEKEKPIAEIESEEIDRLKEEIYRMRQEAEEIEIYEK